MTTIDFPNVQRVRRAVIWMDGSGAIDNILFNPLNIGRIGDTVWCDLNNDGALQPGEPGIPGVRVDLRCAGLDGVLDTADDTLADTVSNANGRYQFTGLLPGLCRVTVDTATVPTGKVPGLCPLVYEVDLIPFGVYRKADFCFIDAPARIGDFVWCDTNDDGVQDPPRAGHPERWRPAQLRRSGRTARDRGRRDPQHDHGPLWSLHLRGPDARPLLRHGGPLQRPLGQDSGLQLPDVPTR